MTVRRAAGVLVMLALGVAGGIGLARLAEEAPVPMPAAAPVPGESPSYPSDPEIRVLPDPDTAALATGLPLKDARVGTREFPLFVPVPRGWIQSKASSSEWRWFPPDQPRLNSFFLRVRVIDSTYQSVDTARRARIADLSGAESVADFELESETGDAFVASYVAGDYRRVAMERFVPTPETDAAFAVVALVGRERDRLGLQDLFDRISAGTHR